MGVAFAAPIVGGLREAKMKIETFGYFKQTTEKWRQKELKRLERRRDKNRKKQNGSEAHFHNEKRNKN